MNGRHQTSCHRVSHSHHQLTRHIMNSRSSSPPPVTRFTGDNCCESCSERGRFCIFGTAKAYEGPSYIRKNEPSHGGLSPTDHPDTAVSATSDYKQQEDQTDQSSTGSGQSSSDQIEQQEQSEKDRAELDQIDEELQALRGCPSELDGFSFTFTLPETGNIQPQSQDGTSSGECYQIAQDVQQANIKSSEIPSVWPSSAAVAPSSSPPTATDTGST